MDQNFVYFHCMEDPSSPPLVCVPTKMCVSMHEEVIDYHYNEPQQRPLPAENDDAWMYYDEQETVDINKYTEIRTK